MEPTNGQSPTPDTAAETALAAVVPAPIHRGRGGTVGNRGGQAGRSGPPSNKNASRHGCYSVGKLPEGASYVRKLIGRLRIALETAVRDKDGEVGIVAAATIQSVCRHECVALLAQRWLRQRAESMSDSDRLNYAKAIADASDKRDKCIRALGLERSKTAADVWATIYSRPAMLTQGDGSNGSSHNGNGADKAAVASQTSADVQHDSEAGQRANDATAGHGSHHTTNGAASHDRPTIPTA